MKDIHPMTPLLVGWLMASVAVKGAECMNIAKITPLPPEYFVVEFSSGLRLRVGVREEYK